MTLFGALSSGVSGLTAQSSAIGAISDNITNVSTVGYKNTQVDFQTLVTKQTSATFFSAGGVQSKPRQDTGVQGLLASSSSSTDIAISGAGFFVVNEAAQPTINNEFLFTRAGSFFQDNEGYLRNTAGFYLQGWPTDAAGVVVPANKSFTVPNQNVISTDFLTTVNLNRVGGTASATSTIAIGANLPSNDLKGTTRKTDVQFFDTLGNATTMSLVNTKSGIDNNWDLSIAPPPGTAVISLEDAAGLTYGSQGQLEFKSRPADAANVKIDGITYEFDNTATTFISAETQTFAAGSTAQISTVTWLDHADIAQVDDVTIEVAAAQNNDVYTVTVNGTAITETYNGTDTATQLAVKLKDKINIAVGGVVTAVEDGAGNITITADAAGTPFTATTTVANGSEGGGTSTSSVAFTTPNQTAGYETGDEITVTIEGNDYTFALTAPTADNDAAATAWFGSAAKTALEAAENVTVNDDTNGELTFTANPAGDAFSITATQTVAAVDVAEGDPTVLTTTPNVSTKTITAGGGLEFSQFQAGDQFTISGTTYNNKTFTIESISADGREITTTAGSPDLISEVLGTGTVNFTYAGFTETAIRRRVDVSTFTTVAQDVSKLLTTIMNFDTDFDLINNRVKLDPGNSTTLLFVENGTADITIDPSGMLTSDGTPVANQSTLFTVEKVNSKYSEIVQMQFTGLPGDGQSVIINTITYTFETAEAGGSGFDKDTTIRIDSIANMIQDLEESIEANDPNFPALGTALRRRESNNSGTVDTLVLPTLDSGPYDIQFSNPFTNIPAEPDSTAAFTAGVSTVVNAEYGIVFNADGIPSSFNVTKLKILGFSNGAADMNDDPNLASKITLDLGTPTEANGFTQFGGSFTPVFITQNGSQFGTFAGVTFSADGLVTALFDNGETRPVYKVPVATFVNVNGLGGRTGNIWNATEGSGDPTLRVADNGPAGQINQSTLEQSTVDIGTEFTKMIVVQRAFSAAAKIITTADEMLEELLRTKR